MYWQQESESMDRQELEHLQRERVESILNRPCLNVPFYMNTLFGMQPLA